MDEPATCAEPFTEDAPLHDEPGPATPTLIVVSGSQLGRRISLSKESTTIGRSRDADVRLDDPSLSRTHASVRLLPGGDLVLEDLGSSNGTFAGGLRLDGPHLLRSSDRFQLGARVILQFAMEDSIDKKLAEAQKLEIIGRLSAGITHDFNNLLSVLDANTRYIQELDPSKPLGDKLVRECLDDMQAATRRATELTRQLACFTQGERDEDMAVSMTSLCDEVVRMIERLMPRNIEVDAAISPNLIVEGSRARLHQLLLNPCINARDAMIGGGRLSIRARALTTRATRATRSAGHTHHVVIEFEDDGPGMDAETASRAFNPFFTTKKDSGGTGLGLATVAKVAREHGGHVELDSTPGRGTTVRVTLPAARPRTSDAAYVTSPSEACEPAMVGRRVLLVEDEALVARSTARTLQRSGHQIDIASDGLEAIERFRQSPAEVVVMDVDMPVMDGPMCYQRLCALDPEVKVIFISGKSSPSLEASLLSLGAQAFVPKPLDFRRLSRAIRRAVTGASTPPNEEPA